ncbi:cytochrome P450 [Ascobolus immersus RN42]|uniref:Cytochrome P450 n=1 Tax=Ascobolus immersus RN42 TaxID=1160509 RepID=A0A3N4HP27_ASCIM|nr:cytochrome P450 [Ascobolus immersus RN42]
MAVELAKEILQAYQLGRDHLGITLLSAFIAWRIWLIIYRLYFHPLAQIGVPGPFLAKITSLYEFYYDYLCRPNGQLQFHVGDVLHPKYGEIVRISPDKVRINNLEAYRKIHSVGSKFTKDPAFYSSFGIASSSAFMVDQKDHRIRRNLMNHPLSKKEVAKLEPLMRETTQILVKSIDEAIVKGGTGFLVFELHRDMRAISSDLIMVYAYGESYDLIRTKGFNKPHPMLDMGDASNENIPFMKYLPVSKYVKSDFATKVIDWFLPFTGAGESFKTQQRVFERVKKLRSRLKAGLKPLLPGDPITLFSELIDAIEDDNVLAEESLLVYFAGLDTAAFALARACYFLAKDKALQNRLLENIRSIWPDPTTPIPHYQEFERLPYFSAFLKEVFRLSYGVTGTLPRLVPPGGAKLGDYFFPEGTRVETSCYTIHHHPKLWGSPEESHRFDPERWLRADSKELEKWIVNFGYGSRSCVGIYFATMEVILVLCTMVNNYEIELGETLEKEGMIWVDKWLPINRNKWEVKLRKRSDNESS